MSVGYEYGVAENGSDVIHLKTNRRPTMSELASDLEQVEKIGSWIFKSKFFGCDYPEQAMMIASECYLTETTPLEYLKRNKVIAGKPSFQQYDAMLAGFNERGGIHKILRNDAECAEIEFTFQGRTETRSLSWSDAKQESFPYAGKESEIVAILLSGKEPPMKPKYATPRSRATMLFARLVSASIRTICPSVNYGTYTEEEFDTVDSDSVVVQQPQIADPVKRAERSKRISEKVAKEDIVVKPPATVIESPAVEVAKETEEPVKMLSSEDGPIQSSVNDPMTLIQRGEILRLMAEVNSAGLTDIKDRVKKKLTDSGLTKLADLNQCEAALLITALAERNVGLWFDSSLEGVKSPS